MSKDTLNFELLTISLPLNDITINLERVIRKNVVLSNNISVVVNADGCYLENKVTLLSGNDIDQIRLALMVIGTTEPGELIEIPLLGISCVKSLSATGIELGLQFGRGEYNIMTVVPDRKGSPSSKVFCDVSDIIMKFFSTGLSTDTKNSANNYGKVNNTIVCY